MIYLLAIICPPLALFIKGKTGHLLINIVLCFVGYLPAMMHAFIIISLDNVKKHNEEFNDEFGY